MLHQIVLGVFCALSIVSCESPTDWINIGRKELEEALNVKPVTTRARNVVMFVGDGMGLATVTATRILKGQLANKTGEEQFLNWETFPYAGIVKTYCNDQQVTDSAAAAMALFSGQKSNGGVTGLSSLARYGDCSTNTPENAVASVLQWAQEAGKATGFVTTTRVTHATPAGLYAHSPNRNWECDADIPVGVDQQQQQQCPDIAKQLIRQIPGNKIQVAMGGGTERFLPAPQGLRGDGLNLLDEWTKSKRDQNVNAAYVDTVDKLNAVNTSQVTHLFGTFGVGHLTYELLRERLTPTQPSLSHMTRRALEVLKKNPNGFFLMVEGGRIDLAHHANLAKIALHETLEMERAVQMTLELLPEDDNLIVVAADHSYTVTIAGYPKRGNNIFGFANDPNPLTLVDDELPVDGKPYTTLSYANGPNGLTSFPRRDLTFVDTNADDFMQDALVQFPTLETHGGEDVGVWAKGPWAHLFASTKENHFIPYAIDYAACYRQPQAAHCALTKGYR